MKFADAFNNNNLYTRRINEFKVRSRIIIITSQFEEFKTIPVKMKCFKIS